MTIEHSRQQSAENERSVPTSRPSAARPAGAPGLLALQRLAGNRAVAGLLTQGARPAQQPAAVQRVLSVGDQPVNPNDHAQASDYCKKKFEELRTERLRKLEADASKTPEGKAAEKKAIEAELTWTDNLATKLKGMMNERTRSYSVADPEKLVQALRTYATTGSLPAEITVKDIDVKKAENAHQLRQTVRHWRVNQLAPEQMPKTGSAFHKLGEADVAPLERYRYGWARKDDKYLLTHRRGETPRPVRFQPFGRNSLEAEKGQSTNLFGYTASVGSGSSQQLAFGLVKNLKGTKRRAPKREDRDDTYGGWDDLKGMTRGHMNPHLLDAEVLDKRPTKRMRSKGWRGDEDFTPKRTSASPFNFNPENMAFGQGVRKFVEGKLARKGGTLRQHNLYDATPGTVETQVEGKGGGTVQMPYPGQVILDATLPSGATFYGKTPLTADTRFTAKFPNAPEVNYSGGVVDPITKKMVYPGFTAKNPTKTTRQKLQVGKTGGGAREHFKGNEIGVADVPMASIFRPESYGTYKPGGDYTAAEEYKPPDRSSVPGYRSPPPSPQLSLGAQEKTVVLAGKHVLGGRTPDGAEILDAQYDKKTDKTTCTVLDYEEYDPASWK